MMRTLSLGAGVQSSTLALMCAAGEIEAPEIAVFADTQDEPAAVYVWLDWLEKQLPFPIRRVSQGKLSATALQVRTSAAGNRYMKPMIPVYTVDANGKKGMVQRQCTMDYKVEPILRVLRHERKGRDVTQYLGISFDELERMKPSREPWLRNEYPLIDLRMTRQDCLNWMTAQGYPTPPRSACIYCPFHNDTEWKKLTPAEFETASEFEKQYQASFAQTDLDGVPYLHADRVALADVDLSDSKPKPKRDDKQRDFINECEGACGV